MRSDRSVLRLYVAESFSAGIGLTQARAAVVPQSVMRLGLLKRNTTDTHEELDVRSKLAHEALALESKYVAREKSWRRVCTTSPYMAPGRLNTDGWLLQRGCCLAQVDSAWTK